MVGEGVISNSVLDELPFHTKYPTLMPINPVRLLSSAEAGRAIEHMRVQKAELPP